MILYLLIKGSLKAFLTPFAIVLDTLDLLFGNPLAKIEFTKQLLNSVSNDIDKAVDIALQNS